MTNEWNLNLPTNDELIPDLPGEHRERKTNVAAVLEKEHATLGDGNSGGEHKQGSAVAWYLATGSIPALDVEGNALASTDNGRFWLDSTTKILYALDDYSDPTVAGGWLALGHLLGDIVINTDKFTVARATGNTVIDGTLTSTGIATVAKGSLLASSDAPTTDAMISNKKYIDDNIPTGDDAVVNDSESNAMTINHSYKAQTLGFVTAYSGDETLSELAGYAHSAADAKESGIKVGWSRGAVAGVLPFISFLVGKNKYFEIVCPNEATVTWTPVITGGAAPVDQD